MGNLIDTVFNSINEVTDFNVVRYHKTKEGQNYFYLAELSPLQVLREIPGGTPIKVIILFSERHRIAKEKENILSASTVNEFLDLTIPLVENGSFSCKDLTVLIDNQIKMSSHDDGEVHLSALETKHFHLLIEKVLRRQNFDQYVLNEIINQPNLYHKLARPDKIISSFKTFEEFLEDI